MKQERIYLLFLGILATLLWLPNGDAQADASVNGFFRTNLVSEGIFERSQKNDSTFAFFSQERKGASEALEPHSAAPASVQMRGDSFDIRTESVGATQFSEPSPDQANGFAIN